VGQTQNESHTTATHITSQHSEIPFNASVGHNGFEH
jgi:hypothetical protein